MNENILRLILPPNGCDFRKSKNPRTCAESDRSLILPIVVLLMAEKADFFLIFALLYILM